MNEDPRIRDAALFGFDLVRSLASPFDVARHEAGHAVASTTLGWGEVAEVSISRTPRSLGRVTKVGGAQDDRSLDHAMPPVPSEAVLRDPEPDEPLLRGPCAVTQYAGMAAELPDDRGLTTEALRSGRVDRRIFSEYLGLRGLRWREGAWCWPAWEAACELVDGHWGAVLALAAALVERETVPGGVAREIIAAAPRLRNERPAWR